MHIFGQSTRLNDRQRQHVMLLEAREYCELTDLSLGSANPCYDYFQLHVPQNHLGALYRTVKIEESVSVT